MNRHDVHLLQQIRSYPAVTITLPTHRTSPENRQDPIRLKNLIAETSGRLLQEFSKREAGPVLARLDQLADSIDYRYTLDGLACFINQDFTRVFSLPFTLKERVVIDETFATRDLVFALNRTPRYWVLALSEQPTRLYEGTRETLIEIQQEGFPITHEGPGGATALPSGPAGRQSAYRDEYHRQFFRKVDAAFAPFSADDPLPLAVVGVDRYLSFFNEVTSHRNAIVATVNGSHDKTPPHELGALVWPEVKASLAKRREEAFTELDKAIGERKIASSVGEVWRFANEGRGNLLLVEEDFYFPAILDESGTHLLPAGDPMAPGVIDDAVDDIIETVLNKQGRVVFVDSGRLEDHQRIALTLRY